MAKEKTKAISRADAVSRQSAIDKRHRVSKKVYKPGQYSRPFIAPGPGVDLSARRPQVAATSKLKSYFELHENTDKKDKKLETSVTMDKDPPPGFSFVPVGNPELTKTCKELSRENGYMIFIVSDTKEQKTSLSDHVQRVGYHFRSAVVEQACNELGGLDSALGGQSFTLTENDKIPDTQAEIDKQADAALRDLFPRIPNLDREQIIKQSFQKGHIGNSRKGEPVVGLAQGIPLARRVQLAANAHIRHVHTRYDDLLRQTDWYNARRLVEPVCLEIIMKWRGDEETGRDQLDEILREVVLIPDSDDEDEGKDTAESASEDEVQFLREVPSRQSSLPLTHSQHNIFQVPAPAASRKPLIDDLQYDEQQQQQKQQKKQYKERKRLAKQKQKAKKQKLHRPDKQERRGFERYQRYAEAKKRAENGNAASAGLDYGDENGCQETASQPRYPLRSMEGHQLLEGASDGHPIDNASSLRTYGYHHTVRTTNAHPVEGLPEQERLPNTSQNKSANPPLRRQFVHHEMPRDEDPVQTFILPERQRNLSSMGGLPILTEAEHQQRQQKNQQIQRPQKRPRSPADNGLPILTEAEHQQRQQLNQQNQRPQKRPRSPEDRIVESIEKMDIANSPFSVRRNQLPLENTAPGRMQTVSRYFHDMEHDRMDREPIYRVLPERSDIIFVHDEHGRRLQLIDEPDQQYTQPIRYEHVSAPRPRQDAYTFPLGKTHAPVSRPDMSWIDKANDLRQPVLIGSPPHRGNAPAMAPQKSMVFRGGREHNRQTSDNFEDIFYDVQQNQVRTQGGESRPLRSASDYAHQPVKYRVEQRQQSTFGIPSALPRASTTQYTSQEIRRPESIHFADGQQSRLHTVESPPIYNDRGEQIQISDEEVDRILQTGQPVYVHCSTRDPRQNIPQMIRGAGSESPPKAQYVSQAGPRYEFLADRPAPRRVQSDLIMDNQPGYRGRTVCIDDYKTQSRQMQQIGRSPVEHIGADGLRYVTVPGLNGQPDEVLPVRSVPLPPSRPQSRIYREVTIVPERVVDGFDQHGRHDLRYPEQQQVMQPRYGRDEIIVLDE